MKQQFLKRILDETLKTTSNLSECIFIFPTKRCGLFFKKYINEHKDIEKPLFLPKITTLTDFFSNISNINIKPKLNLIFDLYLLYKTISTEKKIKTFDEFYSWANMILNDFNEIDLYLIDYKKIFRQLSNLSEIDENFTVTDNDRHKKFLEYSHYLEKLYILLNEKLQSENSGYYGLIIKQLNQETTVLDEIINNYDNIILAGFNVLSKGETNLFNYLIKSPKIKFYVDMDKYFTEDNFQEAGYFFRKKQFKIKNINFVDNNLINDKKKINILGVPGNISQTKICGKILTDLKRKNIIDEEISVILPDESLLYPLLYSIPDSVNKFNVTMGYSVLHSQTYSFVDILFDLFDNYKEKNNQFYFYFKDVMRLLLHPYLRTIKKIEIQKYINKIKKEKTTYILIKDINDLLFNLLPDNNLNNLTLPEFTDFLLKILFKIFEEFSVNKNKLIIESEFIYEVYKIIIELKNLIEEYNIKINIKTFRNLLKEILSSKNIPFAGEPLCGLQIMGMLESRFLDFKNIIMLSVNEDIVPAAKTNNSFIPYEIRKQFELPTYELKQAVYAYNFYRLLKYAENIYYLYNTEHSETGKGGKSRFLEQILYEFKNKNSLSEIKHNTINFSTENKTVEKIEIIKTPQIQNKLLNLNYSVTALKKYLNCSLSFYYHYILEKKKKRNIVEYAESLDIGNIIHNFLYEVYRNKKQTINKQEILNIQKNKNQKLEYFYKKELNLDSIEFGRNKLYYEICLKLIDDFFDNEILSDDFNIISVENKYNKKIDMQDFKINLFGKIDRIDYLNKSKILRIIDYKTGKNKSLSFDIDDFILKPEKQQLEELQKKPEVLQLLFYYYLIFDKINKEHNSIMLGLYPFKEKKYMFIKLPRKKEIIFDKTAFPKIENILKNILKNILDLNIKFVQTENDNICKNCDYKNLCMK